MKQQFEKFLQLVLLNSNRCDYNVNKWCYYYATNRGERMELILNVDEFKDLQRKYSYNTSKMARKIGISRTQLWRVLNYQSNPGEQFIAGFKKAFPEENLDKFFLLKVLQRSDTVKS